MTGEALGELFVLLNLKSTLAKDVKKESDEAVKSLDDVEKSVSKLTDKELKIKSTLASDIQKETSAASEDIDGLSKDVDTLASKDLTVDSTLGEEVTGEVQTADDSINDLTQSIEDVNGETLTVGTDVAQFNTDTNTLQDVMHNILDGIEEVNSDTLTPQVDTGPATEAINELDNTIGDIDTEDHTVTINADTTEAKSAVDNLKQGLDDFPDEVPPVDTTGFTEGLDEAGTNWVITAGDIIQSIQDVSGAIENFAQEHATTKASAARIGIISNNQVEAGTAEELALKYQDVFESKSQLLSLEEKLVKGGADAQMLDELIPRWKAFGLANEEQAAAMRDKMNPAFKQFNVTLAEQPQYFDMMTSMFSETGVSVDDFNSMIIRSGPKMATMGLSLKEVCALLVTLSSEGKKGRAATAALNLAISDTGGDVETARRHVISYTSELGILYERQKEGMDVSKEIKDTQDKLAAAQKIVKIGGPTGADALKDINEQLRFQQGHYEKSYKQISDNVGITEELNKAGELGATPYQKFSTEADKATYSLTGMLGPLDIANGLFGTVAEKAVPLYVLYKVLSGIGDKVGSLLNLGPAAEEAATGIETVVPAAEEAGAAVEAIGASGEGVTGILSIVGAVGAASLLASVGAGIALGSAGVWALLKTGALQGLSDAGRGIEEKFPHIFDALKVPAAPLALLGSTIIDLVSGHWDQIPAHWEDIMNQTMDAGGRSFGGWMKQGSDIVNGVASGISGASGVIGGALGASFNSNITTLQTLGKVGSDAVNWIAQGINGDQQTVKSAIESAFDYSVKGTGALVKVGSDAATGIAQGINGTAATISGAVGSAFKFSSDTTGTLVKIGTDAVSSINQGIDTTGATIGDTIKLALGKVEQSGSNFVDYGRGVAKSIMDGVNTLGSIFGPGLSTVLNFPQDIYNQFTDSGGKIIQYITDGIGKAPKALYDALLKALGPLGDLLPHSPAKEGPLSQEVNFIAYLVDPLNAAVNLMKPINDTIAGIFGGIIDTITGTKPRVTSESSLMFGSFSDEVKKAGANLSPEMQSQLDVMLNDIAARNPDMSARGQEIMQEFLLQVQQNGGQISPEMVAQLDIALTDIDTKTPEFGVRGQDMVDNVLAGINLSAPGLLVGAQGLVNQIMGIFGGVKPPSTTGTEVPAIKGNANYVEPTTTQPVKIVETDLPSKPNPSTPIINPVTTPVTPVVNPSEYTQPIGPVQQPVTPPKTNWTDVITTPISEAVKTGGGIIGGFIGGVGNLLPHSLAKEGPLSVAPNWTSILNDPLEESSGKMVNPVMASVNAISRTLGKVKVGITPEINTMGVPPIPTPKPSPIPYYATMHFSKEEMDRQQEEFMNESVSPTITPTVDNSFISSISDMLSKIQNPIIKPSADMSQYAKMSTSELEKFINESDTGKQLFSQFSGRQYEDPGDKAGTTGWGYSVTPVGIDAFEKKIEEFSSWLKNPETVIDKQTGNTTGNQYALWQESQNGIMPGPKQDTLTIEPLSNQKGGGGGNTYILQLGGVTVRNDQDLNSLFGKWEDFIAAQGVSMGL